MVTAMGLVLVAATLGVAKEPKQDQSARAADYTISGPYAHKNLTIFLIHGKDTMRGKQFLTLQEALDQGKVVVHETQNVNQLSVENVSRDTEVFIQSGDIVKGGQQDRVLSYDLIVSARSGKVPVAAFCVDLGRWQQRGTESVSNFEASINQLGGKDLKLAVNHSRRQDVIWNKIREAQIKLSRNVGKSVINSASPNSLELTLEDKQLLKVIDEYIDELASVPDGKKEIIGYALAINGKIESADVYGSAALFKKLWPKLLRASAMDALAEFVKGKKVKSVDSVAVKAFLADAAKGKRKERDVTKRVHRITQETRKNLLIETRDRARDGEAVHRSYLAK
jgi:hypothetical protein